MHSLNKHLIDVPELKANATLEWLNKNYEQVLITVQPKTMPTRLPQKRQLYDICSQAYNQSYKWILLDGPRQSRSSWVLDPWWKEKPEMSERLLEITKARCLDLEDFVKVLESDLNLVTKDL